MNLPQMTTTNTKYTNTTTQITTNEIPSNTTILPHTNIMEKINTTKTIRVLLKNPQGTNFLQECTVEFLKRNSACTGQKTSIIVIPKTNLNWNTNMTMEQCNNVISS